MNAVLCCLTWLCAAERVEFGAAVLKIAEEAAVPATDAGLLLMVHVREGQLVDAGQLIAQLHDAEARLTVERTRLEGDIAQRKAKNDVQLLFARKSIEVSRAELRRSLETNEKYPKTVSESDLDRQRLIVEKGELEVRQAEHDRDIHALSRDIRENEHRAAQEQLARRRIEAPLRGMVVEVLRHRGEWVNAGEPVARIVRMDRLRAEGFLPARHARLDLVGSKVKLKVTAPDGKEFEVPGEIAFVSPEVDPLNAQVRVWADVANADLKLRPGLSATISLEPR